MISKLYELAFKYKQTELWKVLSDMQIFAIRLSDGRIGYINITGESGEYCSLGLYLEDEGYESFRNFFELKAYGARSPFEYNENFLKQNCIQCAFEDKDMLSDDEIKAVKDFANKNNIKLSGKNAYPQFIKYKPYYYPWKLQTDEEIRNLCEALSAAIELSELLKDKKPRELGIKNIGKRTKEVPILELKNGIYAISKTKVPAPIPEKFPVPQYCNDINIAKLKKLPKKGIWECCILRMPSPFQEKEDDVPVFPVILMAIDSLTNYSLASFMPNYEENPENLLNSFIDNLLLSGMCPKKFKVRDKRTYFLIKMLCDKLNIPLSIEDELPCLEDAEMDLWDRINSTDEEKIKSFEEAINKMVELNDKQLNELPEAIFKEYETVLETGMLPKDVEEKTRLVLNRRNEINKNKNDESNQKASSVKAETINILQGKSCVVSVSFVPGCYRHIQISSDSTLEELHLAISDSFGLKSDSSYAFFMDNSVNSKSNCYYSKNANTEFPDTNMYTLNDVSVYKGMSFKYLYDLNQKHKFQCKILRVEYKTTSKPMIIRKKGKISDFTFI